ncbi:hypothetical protein OHS18_46880 [Amycolatopsis sp. NBC_00355]|uniref:hypothetical protein n=1 Tax=Amycolatopsis sp. NBC_00355 TaxID=2975957 RepID=UPI002E2735B4
MGLVGPALRGGVRLSCWPGEGPAPVNDVRGRDLVEFGEGYSSGCDLDSLRQQVNRLSGAEWAGWPHAYGKARDTPGHLVALLDGEEEAQVAATYHFRSAIVHQSTLWLSSPDAFGWLIRVLRARRVPDAVLAQCLGALDEAADLLADIVPGASVPPLSPAARQWLDRFADAPDIDEDEEGADYELVWEEFLDSDEQEELYQWVLIRTAALRPAVAELVEELAERAPVEVDEVRKAWFTTSCRSRPVPVGAPFAPITSVRLGGGVDRGGQARHRGRSGTTALPRKWIRRVDVPMAASCRPYP